MEHVAFKDWWELLEHVDAGGVVFYRAPFDRNPVRVRATRIKLTARLAIVPPIGADPFIADIAHADRFFRAV